MLNSIAVLLYIILLVSRYYRGTRLVRSIFFFLRQHDGAREHDGSQAAKHTHPHTKYQIRDSILSSSILCRTVARTQSLLQQ